MRNYKSIAYFRLSAFICGYFFYTEPQIHANERRFVLWEFCNYHDLPSDNLQLNELQKLNTGKLFDVVEKISIRNHVGHP